MRTRAELGELVVNIFDRLNTEFDGKLEVNDALLLIEATDPSDDRATVVLLECTSDRVVIQSGILEFARRTVIGHGEDDEDET